MEITTLVSLLEHSGDNYSAKEFGEIFTSVLRTQDSANSIISASLSSMYPCSAFIQGVMYFVGTLLR